MSVVWMSCPQSLWLTLHSAQQPIEWPDADATPKSVESTRRVSGSPINSGRTVRRKGCRKHLSLLRCPHSAERARVAHLRNALVYTGRHLFRARERKDNIVGTIAEPRKGAVWRAILRTG